MDLLLKLGLNLSFRDLKFNLAYTCSQLWFVHKKQTFPQTLLLSGVYLLGFFKDGVDATIRG